MTKSQLIKKEAQAAADKAAALTPYIRGENGNKLRIEDQELWLNTLELRSAYDQLARVLTARAKLEEATEKAAERAPHVVFASL